MALTDSDRRRIYEEERERRRARHTLKLKESCIGCAGLILFLAFIPRLMPSCGAPPSPEEQAREAKKREAQRATDAALALKLHDELRRLDDLLGVGSMRGLFLTEHSYVNDSFAHVYVSNAWYDLPRSAQRDVVSRLTEFWKRATRSDSPIWTLHNTSNDAIGGWSAWKGGYYVKD